MNPLRDPYRSDTFDAELKAVEKHLARYGRSVGERGLIMFFSNLMLAAVSIMILGVVYVDTGWGSLTTGVGVVAAVLAPLNFYFAVEFALYQKAKRRQRELEEEAPSVVPPVELWRDMDKLATQLRSLPRERREEFRPLWETVVETAELFPDLEAGSEAKLEAWQRVRARREAVDAVVREEEALARAQRADAAALKNASALKTLAAVGDEDLELARMYAASLAEGRRRLEEFTQGSQ